MLELRGGATVGSMIAAGSLLAFVLIALIITRVATVALRATGLSHESARFQARSAFSGVGFTTNEAEDIVNHPVRRNIVLWLMLLSTAGVVTAVTSLLLSFVNTSSVRQATIRSAVILGGLLSLWALASSRRLEAAFSRFVERALQRWTDLDAADYVRLLNISKDYSITEIGVAEDEWLNGRKVGDVLLAREGVVVLGIRGRDGHYIGAPAIDTMLDAGDVLVVYGRTVAIDELQQRKCGRIGDQAHERAATAHERFLAEEAIEHSWIIRRRERSRREPRIR
jgi:hypothetical protein